MESMIPGHKRIKLETVEESYLENAQVFGN